MRTVIYHANCVDGFTAAWAAWRKFGDTDTRYIAAEYNDPPPADLEGHVYILDFSYPRAVMQELLNRLLNKGSTLTLLDHHESAMKESGDLFHKQCFDMTRSGARMAWEYFHPGIAVPQVVQFVEDRDLWKFELRNSKEINESLRMVAKEFTVWDIVARDMENDTNPYADMGRALLKQLRVFCENDAARAVMGVLGRHAAVFVTSTKNYESELGHFLLEKFPHVEIAVVSYVDAQFRTVYSLRSRKGGANVAELAVQWGGGGHASAAGFKVQRQGDGFFPFVM